MITVTTTAHLRVLHNTPVGPLYFTYDGETLVRLSFSMPNAVACGDNHIEGSTGLSTEYVSVPTSVGREFDEYFGGHRKTFGIKYSFEGVSPFAMNVYRVLLEIPYGRTRSYKWVAERIGSPKASRAVGHALSANPLPIIVPCHRIVASDGSLGGFSPSIEIKRMLLDIEAGHEKPGK